MWMVSYRSIPHIPPISLQRPKFVPKSVFCISFETVGFSEVKVPEKPILQGFRRSVTSAKVHYIPDVSGYAAKLKIQW